MDIDLNNDFDFEVDDEDEQYASEDGSMYVMLDGREPATQPEDFHTEWGQKISAWLSNKPKSFCATSGDKDEFVIEKTKAEIKCLEEKLKRYELAIEIYKKAGGDFEGLRHAPYVIENYTPGMDSDGDVTRYFIFKESDNGTTYRVIDQKPLPSDFY